MKNKHKILCDHIYKYNEGRTFKEMNQSYCSFARCPHIHIDDIEVIDIYKFHGNVEQDTLLPNDMLFEISKYLNYETKLNMRLVSKQMYNINNFSEDEFRIIKYYTMKKCLTSTCNGKHYMTTTSSIIIDLIPEYYYDQLHLLDKMYLARNKKYIMPYEECI